MADDDRPGYSFTPGPPPEASRFLAAKGMQPAFSWADVEPEEHAVAFSVAKATDLDVLTSIREELQRAIDEGLPFEAFQKALKPRLVKQGWWGVRPPDKTLTGDAARPAMLGTPGRLRTIYHANVRSAQAAGQWERIQRSKAALPYLEYRIGPSERHRPAHVAKAGLILSADDPFWSSWYPPNGWNCRCWVRQVARREAERRGIDEAPATPTREWINHRTGEVKQIPVGIDPGWERNPGAQRLASQAAFLAARLDAAPAGVARTAARDMATSWRARRVAEEGAPGSVPVAMLDEDAAAMLRVPSRVVEMLAPTAERQAARASVAFGEYGRIADVVADGARLLETSPEGITRLAMHGGEATPLLVVVETTIDGSRTVLAELRRYDFGAWTDRVAAARARGGAQ